MGSLFNPAAYGHAGVFIDLSIHRVMMNTADRWGVESRSKSNSSVYTARCVHGQLSPCPGIIWFGFYFLFARDNWCVGCTHIPCTFGTERERERERERELTARWREPLASRLIIIIIMTITNLIYIAQFDTKSILTALYIVIKDIQTQYMHIWTYIKQSYSYTYAFLHTYT